MSEAADLNYHILYDGQKLHWYGMHLEFDQDFKPKPSPPLALYGLQIDSDEEFKATSGGWGTSPKTHKDMIYQWASMQGMKGVNTPGPIPEGWYSLPLRDATAPATVAPNNRTLYPANGVQEVPAKLPAHNGHTWTDYGWGTYRVPLTLIQLDEKAILAKCGEQGLKVARSRSGFYIHSSQKGFTSGCIEVQETFFVKLFEYRKAHPEQGKLVVRVHYGDIDTSTNGGTFSCKSLIGR